MKKIALLTVLLVLFTSFIWTDKEDGVRIFYRQDEYKVSVDVLMLKPDNTFEYLEMVKNFESPYGQYTQGKYEEKDGKFLFKCQYLDTIELVVTEKTDPTKNIPGAFKRNIEVSVRDTISNMSILSQIDYDGWNDNGYNVFLALVDINDITVYKRYDFEEKESFGEVYFLNPPLGFYLKTFNHKVSSFYKIKDPNSNVFTISFKKELPIHYMHFRTNYLHNNRLTLSRNKYLISQTDTLIKYHLKDTPADIVKICSKILGPID